MTAMATKGMLALLEDAYRCRVCGGCDLEFATDGRMRFDGRSGESVARGQAFIPAANPCKCKDNAVGDGAGEAKAARPDADGSHQPPVLPQPCSTVSRSTLAAIDYARANDMLTEKAESAPVESICVVCCGAGWVESEETWPTAPLRQDCRACGGEGVKALPDYPTGGN